MHQPDEANQPNKANEARLLLAEGRPRILWDLGALFVHWVAIRLSN